MAAHETAGSTAAASLASTGSLALPVGRDQGPSKADISTTRLTGSDRQQHAGKEDRKNEVEGDIDDHDCSKSVGAERSGNTTQVGTLSFWLAYSGMIILGFTASLDILMITTALPTILRDLGGSQLDFIWLANSYVLASTAVQPLFGQLANVLGRRILVITAVALFMIGSAVAGSSRTIAQVIAGRCVQGLGSGGILMLLDLITCDLVPLRKRPKYVGALLAGLALGNALGPLLGGAITTRASWRWIFYLNLPVGAAGLTVILLFLKVRAPKRPPLSEILVRIDVPGNVWFIASIISLQIGLLFGGVLYPWRSYQTILPIVLGALGWAAFHFYQSSSFCRYPTIPPHLFHDRTSVVGFLLTFLSGWLLSWSSYFLPLYFQIIRGASALVSGVDVLPLVLVLVPAGGVAGGMVSKTGRYRRVHAAGFALLVLGFGLLSLLDEKTHPVQWAWSQIILAMGLGVPLTTTLPPIQAALAESDAASSTATYSFLRSFGFTWSITIPSVIVTQQLTSRLGGVQNSAVQSLLSNGGRILQIDSSFFNQLSSSLRAQVLNAYVDSFKVMWYVAIAIAGIGFLAVFGEKRLELRTELETEYGMEEAKTRPRPGEQDMELV